MSSEKGNHNRHSFIFVNPHFQWIPKIEFFFQLLEMAFTENIPLYKRSSSMYSDIKLFLTLRCNAI